MALGDRPGAPPDGGAGQPAREPRGRRLPHSRDRKDGAVRLIDYIGLIRQRLALVGAVMGTVALISLGFSMTSPPIYSASVRLRTLPSAPDALGSSVGEVLKNSSLSFTTAGTEAILVQSVEVGQMVADRLGLPTPPHQLVKQVSVQGIPETTVLVLSTSAADPASAIHLANAFADAYLTVRRQDANDALDKAADRLAGRLQEVQKRLADATARVQAATPGTIQAADLTAQRDLALADLQMIRAQLRDLSDREALEGGFGEVIMPATEAKTVRDTSPTRSLVFGVLLGTPVAVAVVLLLDSLSQTVRTKSDAEALTGVEVLGLVPIDHAAGRNRGNGTNGTNGNGRGLLGAVGRIRRNGRSGPALTVDADPFSPISEAYRTASLNLAAAAERAGARALLVTSPMTGEGKTTTTTNLAVCYAERGQVVVMIDADLRRPSAHELLGVDAEPGLAELMQGEATARKVLQAARDHLAFVGSGAPVERPDQLLAGADVKGVLTKLAAVTSAPGSRDGNGNGPRRSGGRPAGGTVLLDSAPVLQAAETLALARAVDGVVLVLRAGVTRRQTAARAVEQLHRAGTPLLGVLLVGVTEGEQLGLGGSYGSSRRALTVVGNGPGNGDGGEMLAAH